MSIVSYLQSKHPEWLPTKCQRVADAIIRKKSENKAAPRRVESTLPLALPQNIEDKMANLSTTEDPTVDF